MTHRVELVRGDITKIPADAIVNAANANLTVGGYVGQAIHDAAGPELAEACLKVPCSRAGDAVITGACLLPARYVIHAVGASWHGGTRHEAEELARTYRRCFAFAALKMASAGILVMSPRTSSMRWVIARPALRH